TSVVNFVFPNIILFSGIFPLLLAPLLRQWFHQVYLEVDLSTGHVDGEELPGLTWLVRPSPPRGPRHRRTRRSTAIGDRKCEMQGVLKFTFTPPPAPTRRPSSRPGDGSVQENDCEVQGYGTTFAVYGSDKHPNVRQKLLHSEGNFLVDKLTLVVSDQTILWNNHRGKADNIKHFSLFALSGQSDSQGDVNYDVFLALNRVIDGSYRSGQGLCRMQARWLE
ncbi:hypothetical protein BaRGS_00029791, partial [Batillaria attramentaria]